ncbi:unnamed protein product, partial [Iphiclides podalirius]
MQIRASELQGPFLKISGRVGGGVGARRGVRGGGGGRPPRRMIYATPVLCFDFNKQSVCHDGQTGGRLVRRAAQVASPAAMHLGGARRDL